MQSHGAHATNQQRGRHKGTSSHITDGPGWPHGASEAAYDELSNLSYDRRTKSYVVGQVLLAVWVQRIEVCGGESRTDAR